MEVYLSLPLVAQLSFLSSPFPWLNVCTVFLSAIAPHPGLCAPELSHLRKHCSAKSEAYPTHSTQIKSLCDPAGTFIVYTCLHVLLCICMFIHVCLNRGTLCMWWVSVYDCACLWRGQKMLLGVFFNHCQPCILSQSVCWNSELVDLDSLSSQLAPEITVSAS